jgi:hypothetical protein
MTTINSIFIFGTILLGVIFGSLILKWFNREKRPEKKQFTKGIKIKGKKAHDNEKYKSSSYSGFSLSTLIAGMITILIGASLYPIISKEIERVSLEFGTINATLIKFVPILFIIGIVFIVFVIAYNSLKGGSVI